MHFYRKKGHQVLDLRGTLALTWQPKLIQATGKSAMPFAVHNAKFAQDLGNMSFLRKLRVLWMTTRFIFSRKYAEDYGDDK